MLQVRIYLTEFMSHQPRTQSYRLCALHAFFRYVALAEPALSLQWQRKLAVPAKRFERRSVEFLTEEEATTPVFAPNTQMWIG